MAVPVDLIEYQGLIDNLSSTTLYSRLDDAALRQMRRIALVIVAHDSKAPLRQTRSKMAGLLPLMLEVMAFTIPNTPSGNEELQRTMEGVANLLIRVRGKRGGQRREHRYKQLCDAWDAVKILMQNLNELRDAMTHCSNMLSSSQSAFIRKTLSENTTTPKIKRFSDLTARLRQQIEDFSAREEAETSDDSSTSEEESDDGGDEDDGAEHPEVAGITSMLQRT